MRPVEYIVQEQKIGVSQCQRVCDAQVSQVNDLAREVGCYVAPGEPIRIPVGRLIGMLILSTVRKRGLELPYRSSLPSWFPGLRQGVLLNIGMEHSSWYVEGDKAQQVRFFLNLAGYPETVRPRIATYLHCNLHDAIRELRVYSANDMQLVRFGENPENRPGQLPLFTLDTRDLASKIKSECTGHLFTVRPKNFATSSSRQDWYPAQMAPYGEP